jgi:hypothetical protein
MRGLGEENGRMRMEYKYVYPSTDKYTLNEEVGKRKSRGLEDEEEQKIDRLEDEDERKEGKKMR